jgi:hypothetical protein
MIGVGEQHQMGFGTTRNIQRLHGQTLVVVGAIYAGYMRPMYRFW